MINMILKAHLIDLQKKIDAYIYNTDKKNSYEQSFETLLYKIQKIDKACESMEELSILWKQEDKKIKGI